MQVGLGKAESVYIYIYKVETEMFWQCRVSVVPHYICTSTNRLHRLCWSAYVFVFNTFLVDIKPKKQRISIHHSKVSSIYKEHVSTWVALACDPQMVRQRCFKKHRRVGICDTSNTVYEFTEEATFDIQIYLYILYIYIYIWYIYIFMFDFYTFTLFCFIFNRVACARSKAITCRWIRSDRTHGSWWKTSERKREEHSMLECAW